jgi:hypothetical protein
MEPDGICEDIMACGGDPTGVWNVRENCAESLVPIFDNIAGCEQVMAAVSVELDGSFGFADGVATQNVASTIFLTVNIDDPCAEALLELSGFPVPGVTAAEACPLFDAQYSMNPDMPGSCSVAGAHCRCEATQMEPAMAQSDTYEVVDDQIVLESSGQTFDFCRDGDELHMHGVIDSEQAEQVAVTLLLDFEAP